MMKLAVALLLAARLLCAGQAYAGVTLESFRFDTPQQEQRFKDLIEELRCLVCQNQSLADSDAELAHDLRAEVYDMLQAGNSDQQITGFLVDRYGDFVLYKPPVKPSTWLIWFGPFALLLIALFLLFRALRRQRTSPQHEMTTEDRQRLARALRDDSGEDSSP